MHTTTDTPTARPEPDGPAPDTAAARVAQVDWSALAQELDGQGGALTPRLLDPEACRAISALNDRPAPFRSTVDMAWHRFGSGAYRYFGYPLPDPVAELRAALYLRLLLIARDWAARPSRPAPWPETLDEWLAQCHDAGQLRPTPLLLRYGAGDWNALHRDLYGDLVFPLQVVIGLDRTGTDYTGGEFMLVEQRPRAQSRGTSITLPQGQGQGQGLVFTTRARPARRQHGTSRPQPCPGDRLPRRTLTPAPW